MKFQTSKLQRRDIREDWYLKVYKKILNVARWLVILAQILLSQTDIKYSFDSFKDGGKGPNFSLP